MISRYIKKCKWYPMDVEARHEITVDPIEPPITFHYFDVVCTSYFHKPTPLCEKLVKTQLYERKICSGNSEK